MRSIALLFLLASLPGAQTLTQSALVQGQPIQLDVSSAAPGASAIFLYSLTGTGSGPCVPSLSLCADLLDPVGVLATVPVDAAGSASFSATLAASAPLITVHTQAFVQDAGAGTASKTNTVTTDIRGIDSFSDTFDGGSLSPDWLFYNPTLVTSSVGAGELTLQPTSAGPSVTWFNNDEGPLLYKDVYGDFTVTAVARVYGPTSPSDPPPVSYRLAGLMARDPNSSPGNLGWVHVAIGAGTPATPVAAEDKTTSASTSDFLLYPIPEPAAELRITRSGDVFSLYQRPVGDPTWQLLRTHSHPEFPEGLQVGMMVYSNQSPPDIAVAFDEISFSF